MDAPGIQQRKVSTKCGYCGKPGHWWLMCRTRLRDLNGQPPTQQQQPAQATTSNNGGSEAPAAPAPTPAAAPADGRRQ
ncbi:hypothetical protein GN958_ATG10208 [Phytophthora infestans]|uniref:CCHC-type domain-containing protein n=1 Tax=Phytophthora infestans TaxID=4787 RepID=A0A8S9UII2_PHYIN|nr:hypothetical protein GN958_ATG18583 [Phytophthora infestans]KAF4140601.1 hypothetical protein GN958_ATG10208 [Phytophthora infestans]